MKSESPAVGDTEMKRLQHTSRIAMWVLLPAVLLPAVLLLAVLLPACQPPRSLPVELKPLGQGYIYVNYECPRCGRRLHIKGDKYEIATGGRYSVLVDKFAGPCSPHRWEYASSMERRDGHVTVTTNEDGSVTRALSDERHIYGDGFWQFEPGVAGRAGANQAFCTIIADIGAKDKAECETVMKWFCYLPHSPTNISDSDEYFNWMVANRKLKEEAATNLVHALGDDEVDLAGRLYLEWKRKYLKQDIDTPTKKPTVP